MLNNLDIMSQSNNINNINHQLKLPKIKQNVSTPMEESNNVPHLP